MNFSLSLPNLGKNTFTFSTGEWAKQAHGSVCVSYSDTVVLATACMSKEPLATQGFLPLTVDYQERTYAMGKIPGGFIKREGRPKDSEILGARLIDRPLRPLFPKGFTHEVQIIALVLSSDGKNDPDVLAVNGASCALFISDIPFYNPVGAVRVAKVDNEFIINPDYDQRQKSLIDLVVVGREEEIVMLEGEFKEISEKEIADAIKFAHPFIREIISLQKKMRDKIGKKKREVVFFERDEKLYKHIKDKVYAPLEKVYGLLKKEERDASLDAILSPLYEELVKEDPRVTLDVVRDIFFVIEEEFVREKILTQEKRCDGRSLKDIRPIDCKVGVLPRTHGSAVFTRGQTQALAVITLGTTSDEQFIEALEGKKSKHFMLHYTFPPFSVGEVKGLRGPSRREIGHGALAEKSLAAVLPPREEFPYTIRVVSEILESNGSSSMATVCASSLSMMDAGIPVKEPVGGIAMGLIKEGKAYKILTDIAGVEDHYGDMDFKVAGTKNGVVAVQLDMKIDGIDYKIIEETFQQAKEARKIILEKMQQALALPREGLSLYAPKIKSFPINSEKIGSVIGPGGSMIRKLSRDFNVTIDIDDETSTVSVVSQTQEDLDKAVAYIIGLTKDIEVGEIYEGVVTRIAEYGAFCEILPSRIGLIHVSEFSDTFVKDVRDFIKEGDRLKVKVIGLDPQGKIKLSIKQV